MERSEESRPMDVLQGALVQLLACVEDWKDLRLAQFGELLLYGQFPIWVEKSSPRSKPILRQYHVYVFERIIIAVKPHPKGAIRKFLSSVLRSFGKKKNGEVLGVEKPHALHLKGRIFFQGLVRIAGQVDLPNFSKSGIRLGWRCAESGHEENCVIRFPEVNEMMRWFAVLETQYEKCNPQWEFNWNFWKPDDRQELVVPGIQRSWEYMYKLLQQEVDVDAKENVWYYDGAWGVD